MKAFEQDSIKRGVVCKQIFDFLLEGKDFVDGATISKMSTDHDKQEVSHARSKYQTLIRDDVIASKDFKLNHVFGFVIEFPKDIIDGRTRRSTKHLGVLIMIRNKVSMVDEEDKHAENRDIIVVIAVNIGWANRVIPRPMVQESAKIRKVHGAQLGIRKRIG